MSDEFLDIRTRAAELLKKPVVPRSNLGDKTGLNGAGVLSTKGRRDALGVVPTGLESETAVVTLNNLQLSLGSRTVVGAQCGGGDVLRLVPELERALASGALDGRRILTASRPLAAAAASYPAMADPAQFTGVITMASFPTDPHHPRSTA